MAINDDDRVLVDFLGYGPPPSSVELLFFGQEERCSLAAIELNLMERRRKEFPNDKNEACKVLAAACETHGDEKAARIYRAALDPHDSESPPQWRFAAKFAQRFFETADWVDEYTKLGTLSGKTFLAERFPLPRPWNGYRFKGRDEGLLTREHLAAVQDGLVKLLRRGTVVISYAGGATDLLGPMTKVGNRAWTLVAGSVREKDRVQIAQPQRHPLVVVQVPTLKKDDDIWWEEWLSASVAEAKSRAVKLAREAPQSDEVVSP